jgi:hypothetical protein
LFGALEETQGRSCGSAGVRLRSGQLTGGAKIINFSLFYKRFLHMLGSMCITIYGSDSLMRETAFYTSIIVVVVV